MLPDLTPYRGAEHLPFDLGHGEAGALLIHGFTGTPAEMRPLGARLAAEGYRSRGILLPGFGPDIVNLNRCRQHDWLAAAEDSWNIVQSTSRRSILIGYSMGAAIAIHLAQKSPPDLLVLVAPFWKAPGVLPLLLPAARRFFPSLRPFRKADFNDPRLRHMLARILPDADLDTQVVQQTIREEFVLPLAAIHEVLKMGKHAYRQANQLHSRNLVIQGQNDIVVRPQESRKLVSRLPKNLTRYVELQADHELITEESPTLMGIVDLIYEAVQ